MTAVTNQSITGIAGQSLRLEFSVSDAYPTVLLADVTWTLTGSSGQPVDITSSGDARLAFSSDLLLLEISALTVGDRGTYTFAVSNIAGPDSASIELTVLGESNTLVFHYECYYTCVCFRSFSSGAIRPDVWCRPD